MVVVSMQDEPPRERASAIVSPASGEMVFTEPGKAAPVAVAPAYTGLKDPLRPCDIAVAPFAVERVWQPLQARTSPGRTDSQEACTGPTLRPFASSSEILN